MAAVVSAPIAAYVFGGVTGFGGDAVIAAFRAAGASLYQATLAQGLLADQQILGDADWDSKTRSSSAWGR